MDELFLKKWRVFEKRARLFRHVPFVEFVLLAGSMATGKVREESDFDVILGVRYGRVWTAFFFSSLFYELRGWREHPGVRKRNRVAVTHLATPRGYKLSGPYDAYWENLYQKLIPAMGDERKMAEFFTANDWLQPLRAYERHERYIGEAQSVLKRFLEFILGGRFGDVLERALKKWLTKRLQHPAKLGYKPRLVLSDDKLEIYRDTRRIEEMLVGTIFDSNT